MPYVNGLILQDSTQLSQKFITDKAGNYQVQNLQPGNYRVSLSYTGYLKMDTAIQISNSKEQEQVPKQGRAQQLFIYLTPKFSQLSAVKIKAQKPYLEMDKGKFILNVQQSALAKSSSAWDALKYAPTVITSSAGSLTVLNKPTVVYIDGRRVHQSGEALMQYLQGIPASNIDKIEVIGHPDASYAADISTVIKISTIKYKDDGIKGNITFRGIKASFLHKYINGTVNYKKGALYLQSGYGFSYAKNKIINNYEKLGQTGSVWMIPQQSISSTNTNRFYTTLGYDFNKNNKLTFYTDITSSTNHFNLKANNGNFTDDRSNDSIYRFNAKGSNKSISIQSQMTY